MKSQNWKNEMKLVEQTYINQVEQIKKRLEEVEGKLDTQDKSKTEISQCLEKLLKFSSNSLEILLKAAENKQQEQIGVTDVIMRLKSLAEECVKKSKDWNINSVTASSVSSACLKFNEATIKKLCNPAYNQLLPPPPPIPQPLPHQIKGSVLAECLHCHIKFEKEQLTQLNCQHYIETVYLKG